MAKAPSRRGRKPSQNETAALLTAALDFLSAVPDKRETPNFAVINGQQISVNNGLLKAGIVIGGDFPDDTVAKVQMSALVGALGRVGKEMAITFGDDAVSIEAGPFEAQLAQVPINMDTDRANPDDIVAPLNNDFRDALNKVARLVSDTSGIPMTASIAVLGPSVMSTKRHTIIEAWHGNDMPYGVLFLPKAFATALAKVKADVSGFGFSATTFTVHFTNGGYLQTNTYADDAWTVPEKQPAYVIAYKLLDDAEGTMITDPAALVSHLEAITAVTDADVWISLGKIESDDGAARLDASDMVASFGLAPARYIAVADLVGTLKLVTDAAPARLLFWGDKVRGTVIVDKDRPTPAPVAPPATWGTAPAAPPAPAWAPPPANPTSALTGTPQSSAPAAMPESSSPISGNGPSAQPSAFPSSAADAGTLFDDDD